MYGQLSSIMESRIENARLQSDNAELKMEIQENTITIERRYMDLSNKIDVLCKYFSIKLIKSEGYKVIKL